MSRTIDPDSLGFLLNDLARLMRAAFEHEIAAGAVPVTPSEARVLANMYRSGPMQQKRLACLLGVAPMSLSTFLDRLEAAGLVVRSPDPDDRRAKLVSLTPAAGPVLTEIAEAGLRARQIATKDIDEPTLEQFRATAHQIRDTLDTARTARIASDRKPTE
ncbi:MarR family winged helix-turn-helix transcriptional regulator [Puniceibacterium sediminis]|uniref:DNA-binding transcriptional regulator, MarR family n=1 Tax=Puniceibacterium sediminis TaxID=1608407 RepID=A0A238VEI8_9RHOB|nr:MarR family transcriptional regulator [Puniceibacterium sediminis]SNR32631.1 DNA-binding transcriptional regulator, MarR family [Puniceibacterium sediminis]